MQLPDFQRDSKWDDARIISLLATVTRGYPIGVVMTLETGGDGVRFKPKPLAGVDVSKCANEPDQLLLDGQQRMTSLFQSLMSGHVVETTDARGKRLKRWYYIDIVGALGDEGDREDAIFGVPEDRVVREDFGRTIRRDYMTVEQECQLGAFPLRLVFDNARKIDWLLQYIGSDPDRRILWQRFQDHVLRNLESYLVPVIRLVKATPKRLSARSLRRSTPAECRLTCSSCSPPPKQVTETTSRRTVRTSGSTTTGVKYSGAWSATTYSATSKTPMFSKL